MGFEQICHDFTLQKLLSSAYLENYPLAKPKRYRGVVLLVGKLSQY